MNDKNEKQLDLLATFHFVLGGIMALFSCMPFIHVLMGLAMLSGNFFGETEGSVPPEFMGWIFVIMGSIFIIAGWITSALIIIAGKKLKQHKGHMYCMIIAGIECMFMPFGTALGVFTLISLNKEPVKALFVPPEPPAIPQQ